MTLFAARHDGRLDGEGVLFSQPPEWVPTYGGGYWRHPDPSAALLPLDALTLDQLGVRPGGCREVELATDSWWFAAFGLFAFGLACLFVTGAIYVCLHLLAALWGQP